MKIFVKTAATDQKNTTDGYGSAKYNIEQSLIKLGHIVPETDSDIDIQLNFARPPLFKTKANAYNIGYTPWESLTLPKNWKNGIESCDEMWTTSDFCANIFEDHGFKNVKIYHHGIEKIWTPKKRENDGVIKFLHIGLPEGRKGGIEALGAFIDLYGNDKKVSLTLKAYPGISFDKKRIPSNVKVISSMMTKEELVKLHHDHDVMLYPSYGEGFGLIPLQALATGMPVISTAAWAPYRKYLEPLSITSSPVESEWVEKHPGTMLRPSMAHLGAKMNEVISNFDQYSSHYYNQAQDVIDEYDWVNLTEKAFSHLIK